MRIAFFTEAVPPVQDGVVRTLSTLTPFLDAQGIAYRFISGVTPAGDLAWRNAVHTVAAVPFPLYREYRFALPMAPRLDAVLDRFEPDLLHAANPSLLGVYALSYARRRNLPVVSSYHTRYVSYLPYYGMGRLQRLGWTLLRAFHSRCRLTYVPSRSAQRELESQGIPRLDIWARGVDRNLFHPRFRTEELRRSIGAGDLPVLLFVGRLVKEKSLLELAEAAGILARRGVRFRLVFVGEGPLGPRLRALLPEAHFTGYLTGADLSRWYASADGFVFPSTTETFGNVILEAMASGIPVIGADAVGTRDLVEPGRNGFLVRPRDPQSLADGMQRLLEDAPLRSRLAEGALATASRFDWGGVHHRLLAGYERVIREHRRPLEDPALELAAG